MPRANQVLVLLRPDQLLRDALDKEQLACGLANPYRRVIHLLDAGNDAGATLEEIAAALINNYLTESKKNSFLHEARFRDRKGFNFDLNGFLKWEQLRRISSRRVAFKLSCISRSDSWE